MVAISRDLFIEQGATFYFHFQWRTPAANGTTTPKNLTGWTVRMQVRKNQQSALILDASTTNGKIRLGVDPEDPATDPDLDQTNPNLYPPTNPGVPQPSNGWIRLRLTDEDTDILNTTGRYDLEAESPRGDVYRLLQGGVSVSGNITQDADDPPVV